MKQKTPEIERQARVQIAQTLPLAMEKAINSYHDFVDQESAEEATDFKNRHMAAKAALAHIELLIRLARMVDAGDEVDHAQLDALIAEAKRELGGINE